MSPAGMAYNLDEFASLSNSVLMQKGIDVSIENLLIDSRLLLDAPRTVFFALKTIKNDGHRYIPELYDKGVRAFVVSHFSDKLGKQCPEACFFLSEDVLQSLQSLAAAHRAAFSCPVLGISGSNGKTTVKEWLRILLADAAINVIASPKSYNSQIGVPLSVWQLNPQAGLGIFEAGISRPGEMAKLQKIIRPDTGIFTNIGSAHSADFKNRQEKIQEKLKLFSQTQTIICSSLQQELYGEIQDFASRHNIQLFSWGMQASDDIQIISRAERDEKIKVTYRYQGTDYEMHMPFQDEASFQNVMHCLAFLLLKGHKAEWIHQRIALLSPLALRLEQKSGKGNTIIINDSYNSDLESLRIALDFLQRQKRYDQKSLILSDIQESGLGNEQLFTALNKLLSNKDLQKILAIGPVLAGHKPLATSKAKYFLSTDEFLEKLPSLNFHDEAILLKGARAFGFERISKALEAQSHETVLEVNLDALVHNLDYYRSQLPQSVKIMAMVKANSYGAGNYEIASLLQFHHVDYLAVAYADEGVELRRAGIRLPIMVMNPEESAFDDMLHFELEPEIYSLSQLKKYAAKARAQSLYASRLFKIHIKLDTGMRRLGFESEDLPALAEMMGKYDFIRVQSIFSHLAASDEPQQDAFTARQAALFQKAAKTLKESLSYPVLCHILNTAGINRHSAYTYDMVRLGLGLYGISSIPGVQKNLRPVSRLKTVISQTKKINKGESVGYSRSFTAPKDMAIAVIPIGYADGVNRHLSNKGHFMLRNRPVAVLGNVCMDMCMIDISAFDDVKAGEEVTIFGPEWPVAQLAEEAGTIAYELLTAVSRRVKRIYYHE